MKSVSARRASISKLFSVYILPSGFKRTPCFSVHLFRFRTTFPPFIVADSTRDLRPDDLILPIFSLSASTSISTLIRSAGLPQFLFAWQQSIVFSVLCDVVNLRAFAGSVLPNLGQWCNSKYR